MSGDGEAWTVKDSDTLRHFVSYVTARYEQGITYSIQRPNRTGKQNNAIHACLRRLARSLNEAGYGVAHPLKPELEIPYSESSVKELLLKPIISALYDVDSTSKLDTEQVSKAMGLMLNRVAELTGVVEEFILGELSHE